jgi:transposase
VPTTSEGLSLLRSQYRIPEGTKVATETGTVAFFVANELEKLDFQPVVIDAREVRVKAQRPKQKSDRRDADDLCEGIRRGIYRSIVPVPNNKIIRLRRTLSVRRHMVRLMTREINAAKRLIRACGLGHLNRSLTSEDGWDKLMDSIAFDKELKRMVKHHRQVWSMARCKKLQLEKSLEKQKWSFGRDVAMLQGIPGVGPIVALTAVSVIADAKRFPSAKHVASYTGLVPSTYQSGDREAHGRITKQGSSELRAMLCEAAHHAARKHHPLNPYFARHCVRRGYKMAVVAVAHRLCRIMYAMLRDGKEFEISQLGVEQGDFTSVRKRVYRLKTV